MSRSKEQNPSNGRRVALAAAIAGALSLVATIAQAGECPADKRVADGALLQLAELIGYGYLSLLFYVLFKACEHVLVTRLAGEKPTSCELFREPA